MKTFCLLSYLKKEETTSSIKEQIIDFYNEATEDYQFWSKDLNMHFGYYIPFKTNTLIRDTMLNAMNNHLFSLLNIKDKKAHVVDLGCGMGTTLLHGIQKYPKLAITGCTISPFQVEEGNKRIQSERGTILNRDYRNTFFKDESFDGAIAIESLCHSGCSTEALEEAYRILKPNSTFVIADAFSKKDKEAMNPFSKKVYDGLCASWSLKSLGNIKKVKQELERIGFKDVQIKNIWYRVAPSVLHVPFAISGFILKKLFKGEKLKPESTKNLKGSFYALLTSLCLQDFGYYTITAKK